MRAGLVVGTLVGLALLAAPSARAVPFTSAFDELIANLESRRDENYEGTLDKRQKKELAAIHKVLSLLDRPADDLGDDLKAAAKAAATLAKAFPDEFGPPVESELGDVLVQLLGNLEAFVDADFTDLEGDLPGLSDRGKAKVQAALEKAAGGLDGEYDEFMLEEWGKALATAFKAIAKGEKVVAADPGPTQNLVATVDGSAVGPNEITVQFYGGVVSLLAIREKNPPKTISLAAQDVTGAGTYDLVVGSHTVGPETNSRFYILVSGTMTVESLDEVNRLVSFTFSYTAADASADTVTVEGSYSGPYEVPAL